MTAKAISFTPEVLRAKLRALEEYGRCQTRRPVVVPRTGYAGADLSKAWADPTSPFGSCLKIPCEGETVQRLFPPHQQGDTLWIRERALVAKRLWRGALGWKVLLRYDDGGKSEWLDYPSRLVEPIEGRCIANGVFRDGARHFLEVVEVRAERLHDVTDEDARLEWFERRLRFLKTFTSIYGEPLTLSDPWCWVYTLKRTAP